MPAAEESDREGADEFATYMMLQVGKDDAYQMIMGATFTFKNFIDKSEIDGWHTWVAFSLSPAPPTPSALPMRMFTKSL